MGDNVKVAVRCRPFNARETNMNAKCIIKVQPHGLWKPAPMALGDGSLCQAR
jgi:hypothetical protein